MSTHDPFVNFDPTLYQTVANLPLQTIVTLAKALGSVKPKNAPVHVEQIAQRLEEAIEEAEAGMVVRLREQNEGGPVADQVLDNAVDPLWSLFCRRLGAWAVYERPGLDFIADDPNAPPEIDIVELRNKAARARKLSECLFGSEGLGFLQRPYPEQAQLMANILGLIDADNLAAELIELTGLELLPLLRHCQPRYEQMVHTRAMRDNSSATDLRSLRGRLRRLIVRYAVAVITMLDESAPETLEIVETALKPMLTIRVTPRPVLAHEEEEEDKVEDESEAESEAESEFELETEQNHELAQVG